MQLKHNNRRGKREKGKRERDGEREREMGVAMQLKA